MIGDDLYRRNFKGALLKCINQDESMRLMGEVHEGLCGSQWSGLQSLPIVTNMLRSV